MAVHVFVTNETNYAICVDRGIVALPEAKPDSKDHKSIFDALLSRMACVKDDDYILIYIGRGTRRSKELHGVWRADGNPFYEEAQVWPDRMYPFRCRIKPSEYRFEKPLRLADIYDLRNAGQIWSWSLKRASGPNSMFSLSTQELHVLLREFAKINPFGQGEWQVRNPYPFREPDLLERAHRKPSGGFSYESTIMAFLANGFNHERFVDIFGNYDGYLSYVPTTLETEIDYLLLFYDRHRADADAEPLAYDLIEVKRDVFDLKALRQLLGYEAWLLKNRAAGDRKRVRSTAIGRAFAPEVIDYVARRSDIESAPVKLLEYHATGDGDIELAFTDMSGGQLRLV